MKKCIQLLALFISLQAFLQIPSSALAGALTSDPANTAETPIDSVALYKAYKDSVNASMKYQTGLIHLKGADGQALADLKVPEGFRYLDAEQSNYVLSELWGNPKSDNSLGMLFPDNSGPMTDDSYAFNIQYDEVGYVEDDDADDIDYDNLLEDMQKELTEENPERQKAGYEAIELVGWAAKPYYDKEKHILHWAKELKFGTAETHTLNYNVRVLGRKGVLVLNAISSMNELKAVNQNIGKVTDIVTFADGNRYTDFNPSVDKVAAYTLGGLVAGKVLAKAGFFAILLKFWKVIALAIGGGFSYLWKMITGRKKEEDTLRHPEGTSESA